MNSSNSTQAIPPFWTRLRSFARFPFRGDALITLICLSAAQWLTSFPVLGLVVWVLLMLMAYKYAFSVLRETANGHRDPEAVLLEAPDSVVFKFIGMNLVLLVIVMMFTAFLGPTGLALGLIFASFVQPAATMSLAMDEDLGNALNPATWLAIISRIGLPYGLLWLLLIVFQMSAWEAEAWLDHLLPGFLAIVIAHAAFLWGLFATYHLMGYLLYQFHEALGFEPNRYAIEAAIPRNRESELVARAQAQVREGQPAAALALLREEMRERALSLEAHELLRRLLRTENDPTALQEHARSYLHLLMQETQERKALALARESLDADPAFAPLDPQDGLRLADIAERMSQHKLATDVLIGTARSHPRDPAGTTAALRAARLLRERYDRADLAKQLLEFAHAHCKSEERRGLIAAELGSGTA